MIPLDDTQKKKFKITQLIGIVLLLFLPLVYLGAAYLLKFPPLDPTANDLNFRLLIIIALLQPVLVPTFEKLNIAQLKKNKNLNPIDAFMTVMIIRYALVEAIYIYGFVVYLTGHNFERMLYFYPLGIIATIVYFPRESTLETFIEKLNEP